MAPARTARRVLSAAALFVATCCLANAEALHNWESQEDLAGVPDILELRPGEGMQQELRTLAFAQQLQKHHSLPTPQQDSSLPRLMGFEAQEQSLLGNGQRDAHFARPSGSAAVKALRGIFTGGSADLRQLFGQPATGPLCKRLLWFTAISAAAPPAAQRDAWDQLAAAIMSARDVAPSVQPVVVLLGAVDLSSPEARWVAAAGGLVVPHVLSFDEALRRAGQADSEAGLAVLDVALVVERLRPFIGQDKYELRTVLATHTNVLFQRDIDVCKLQHPRFLSMALDSERAGVRSSAAVMLNVSAMAAEHAALHVFGADAQWQFPGDEQGLLEKFFELRAERHAGRFVWQPCWGHNDAATLLYLGDPPPGSACALCFATSRPQEGAGGCPCGGGATLPPALAAAAAADGGVAYKYALTQYYRYLQISGLRPDVEVPPRLLMVPQPAVARRKRYRRFRHAL